MPSQVKPLHVYTGCLPLQPVARRSLIKCIASHLLSLGVPDVSSELG